MGVGIIEQPAQAGDGSTRVEARAVEQRLPDLPRGHRARLRVRIAEGTNERSGAGGSAQARE